MLPVLSPILYKLYHLQNRSVSVEKIPALSQANGNNFMAFNDDIIAETKTKIDPEYKLRFREIHQTIQRYHVKTIIEIGSGRSTYILNSYDHVKVVSYEQDMRWKSLLEKLFERYKHPHPTIRHQPVIRYKNGGKFEKILEQECDMLYIDGPYVAKDGGKPFETYTGKAAYYDFETLMQNGIFPKVVMIEGRIDTTDAIRQSAFADRYRFLGCFPWAMRKKNYFHAIALRRHSFFVRKT